MKWSVRANVPDLMTASVGPRYDAEWISALRAGDEPAFEALFREQYERLCAYASRLVGDPETAEEIVQSVLLRVWQQRETIAVTGTVQGYLYGAVRNQALMSLRRQRLERRWRERTVAAAEAPLMGARPPQPDEWIRTSELADAVQEAIDRLPPRCREAFLLRREQHLSYADIARVMGISPKTVEVQIGAALRALRTSLSRWWE